ncbi:MAG: PA14 domain-containing protein, partial [Verrucomicrobia bacterium]|nr:PA14 domain-containing protein [Verrucomicrobiota bacterium]
MRTPQDGVADDEVIGTMKVSAAVALAVPGTPAARYKMRVEHVETADNARCRLQWRLGTAGFANIAQANQFTHTQAATYANTTTTATITLTGHGLINGDSVTLAFTSGIHFTPTSSSGTFTVANATANTFEVPVVATATSSGSCFLEGRTASTSTGAYNKTYAGTTFSGPPLRIGVDGAVTAQNNGIWNTGTPDVNLINPDTFSVRWIGQVQPQFTEEYTIAVIADDGCTLRLNGQVQPLK